MTTENTDPGRIRSAGARVYGIRIRLPERDPLADIMEADTEMYRWYATESERDAALAEMRREHDYSRIGDVPRVLYEKVERERPSGYTRAPQTA
jgi:hypothetical protein